MKTLFTLLFSLSLLLSNVSPLLAQSVNRLDPSRPELTSSTENMVTGNLKCFDYYMFGSVQADLQTNLSQTVPGATLTFSGQIKNNNNYPLIQGKLSVKIFKKDDATFAAGDGNVLVDQFTIMEDIILPAQGTKDASFAWRVPNNADGGEYYAAYFFTTSERYNLLGLSFTDDVVGNIAEFTVTNEAAPIAARLNKVDTTINDQNHNFASFPLTFSQNETVVIKTTVTNPSDQPKTIPLQWNQYAWDAQNDENLRNTQTLLVGLEPGQTRELTYEVRPQREPVVFVTAMTQDREARSMLNIRFVRDGIEETRINFPSVTAFPLQAGVEQTLFACAHSTNLPVVPGNILTLTLTDKAGAVIHQYRYEGDITSAMAGFGEVFTPAKNINYALLTASLERDGVTVEEVKVEYDCKTIDPNSCLPEESENTFLDFIKDNLKLTMIVGGGLILSALMIMLYKRRKIHIKADTTMSTPLSVLFFLVLTPVLLLTPAVSEASKSTQWSSGELPALQSYIFVNDLCYANCTDMDMDRWQSASTWLPLGNLNESNVTVTRAASVRNNTTNTNLSHGAAVSVGQTINFIPKSDEREDIFWNGIGASSDTPYGYWGAPPTGCNAATFVREENFGGAVYRTHVGLGVNPVAPSISHAGTATLNCSNNGFTCVVTGAGTINSTITWPATGGTFTFEVNKIGSVNPIAANWIRPDTCNTGSGLKQFVTPGFDIFTLGQNAPYNHLGNAPVYVVNVPQQSINFTLTASAAANGAPAAPTITGTTSALIDVLHTFGLTATDPDNDTIRYGIDFNNDNSVDQWVPGSGYVNSGTAQDLSRSWATVGQVTFRALTEDSRGAQSAWTSHTITLSAPAATPIDPPPPSCTDGILNQDETGVDTGGICTPPPPPLIGLNFTGPYNGIVGINYTFRLQSFGTDTSDVRYGFDWNRDGITDLWQPSQSAFLAAGTEVTGQQSWTTSGPKVLAASVINAAGRTTQMLHGILIADENQPYVDLKVNDSDGPVTVRRSETFNLQLTLRNVTNCALFGERFLETRDPNLVYLYEPDTSIPLAASSFVSSNPTFIMMCNEALDQVSVNIVNTPPNAPTITHPTGTVEQNITTSFVVLATDPDGDPIYYEIDWDNDPATPNALSQAVPSAQSITANRSWSTNGSYTFQARAIDTAGEMSPWTQYTIVVSNSAPATASIEAQVNGGAWSTDDQTIDPGDSVAIRWSSTDASTCVGTNFNTGGATSGTTGVTAPGPNSATDFTVSCTGTGAPGSDSVRVTTRALPNFNQPNVTYNLSTGYNPVTGVYDSVTVVFQTTNDGGSATKAPADYQVRFDRGSNGYDETRTGSLGLLSVGQAANRTEVFTNVAFSGNRVEVTADSDNDVTESNESDNVRVLDMTLTPPDPNLQITVSRPAVRGGETVTLNWNTNATYPMNCSVFGPGVGPINFNPSVAGPTGNSPTQPITAKSEFTLRCTEPITNTTFTDTATVEIVGSLEEI